MCQKMSWCRLASIRSQTVIVLCMVAAVVADECDQLGGVRGQISNTCYFIPQQLMGTWDFANAECSKRGATLASVHSPEDNDVIAELWRESGAAASLDSLGGIWIGLNDRPKEDNFRWSDGSDLVFWGFVNGRPLVDKNLDCTPDYVWNNGNLEFVDCEGLQENSHDCVSFGYTRSPGDTLEGWVDNDCEIEQPFVCAIQTCTGGVGCYFDSASSVSGSGGPLGREGQTVEFGLNVEESVESVLSVQIRGIRHGWVGDVRFALKDPAGNIYNVLTRHGLGNHWIGSGGRYNGESYTVVSANLAGRDWHSAGLVDGRGVLGNSIPPPPGVYKQTWRYTHISEGDSAFQAWLRVPLDTIRADPGRWTLVVWNRGNMNEGWLGSPGDISGWSLTYRKAPEPVTVSLWSSNDGKQRACQGHFILQDSRLNERGVYVNHDRECFLAHDGLAWVVSHTALLPGALEAQGEFLFFDGLKSAVLHSMPGFTVAFRFEAFAATNVPNNSAAVGSSGCRETDLCLELGGLTVPNSTKCYFVQPEVRGTWSEARAQCRQHGAVLASVRSQAEAAVVHTLWSRDEIGNNRAPPALGGMWLGATDVALENSFVWTDGTPAELSPSPWANIYGQQQPNNWNEQDCVSYGYATTGEHADKAPVPGWVDNDCNATVQPFVCEVATCTPVEGDTSSSFSTSIAQPTSSPSPAPLLPSTLGTTTPSPLEDAVPAEQRAGGTSAEPPATAMSTEPHHTGTQPRSRALEVTTSSTPTRSSVTMTSALTDTSTASPPPASPRTSTLGATTPSPSEDAVPAEQRAGGTSAEPPATAMSTEPHHTGTQPRSRTLEVTTSSTPTRSSVTMTSALSGTSTPPGSTTTTTTVVAPTTAMPTTMERSPEASSSLAADPSPSPSPCECPATPSAPPPLPSPIGSTAPSLGGNMERCESHLLWSGCAQSRCCQQGLVCAQQNAWYAQCLLPGQCEQLGYNSPLRSVQDRWSCVELTPDGSKR